MPRGRRGRRGGGGGGAGRAAAAAAGGGPVPEVPAPAAPRPPGSWPPDYFALGLGVPPLEVETPSFFSIAATRPVDGSKKSLLTFDQPPRSLIVKRPDGVGKLGPPTPCTTGRYPLSA